MVNTAGMYTTGGTTPGAGGGMHPNTGYNNRPTKVSNTSVPLLSSLSIDVTIVEGRDLVAKDFKMFSSKKKGTSDPFVELIFNGRLYGRTRVKKKTLYPKWNEKIKTIKLASKQANSIVTSGRGFLTFQVFDEDTFKSDSMGVVKISLQSLLTNEDNSSGSNGKWYPVETGRKGDQSYCKKASGELLLKITLSARKVLQMQAGNTLPLDASHGIRVGLGWDMEYGQRIDLDSSCVALDSYGNVLMNECVYYGNLTNSNASVRHSGDEREGDEDIDGSGDDERIDVYLKYLPQYISALYFVLTVASQGKTFGQIHSTVANVYNLTTNQCLGQFFPATARNNTNNGNHTAFFLMRLCRDPTKRNMWCMTMIGDTDGGKSHRDFGTLIPELKSYSRDLFPTIMVNPKERIALMRKGGVIRLQDYTQNGANPNTVTMGLSWDVTKNRSIDLDASAIVLDAQLQMLDLVYFKQLQSRDGTIIHSGDERTGDAVGDDERITVHLNRVHPAVGHIAFVVTSYTGQELDDVKRASCRLYDSSANIGHQQTYQQAYNSKSADMDIASYKLCNAAELDKHTGLIMCILSKDAEHGWLLRIVSQPAQGKVARQLIPHVQSYLRFIQASSSSAPTLFVESEIANVMPLSVPVSASTQQESLTVAQIAEMQALSRQRPTAPPAVAPAPAVATASATVAAGAAAVAMASPTAEAGPPAVATAPTTTTTTPPVTTAAAAAAVLATLKLNSNAPPPATSSAPPGSDPQRPNQDPSTAVAAAAALSSLNTPPPNSYPAPNQPPAQTYPAAGYPYPNPGAPTYPPNSYPAPNQPPASTYPNAGYPYPNPGTAPPPPYGNQIPPNPNAHAGAYPPQYQQQYSQNPPNAYQYPPNQHQQYAPYGQHQHPPYQAPRSTQSPANPSEEVKHSG